MKPIVLCALATSFTACSSSGGPYFNSSDLAAPGPADAASAGGSYYQPDGYQLVPFLSNSAQHQFAKPEMVLQAGKDYRAVVETDAGRIVLQLSAAQAPITVNSFVFLALHHYFDGIAFHRVIDGFMAQTGDPNTLMADTGSWGMGGPGYSFGLEAGNGLVYDGAGVLGMARTQDPNSNGSQFFITFAAQHSLDGMYTVFGKVSEGLDVLPKIVRGEPPATPTRMTRVYVIAK